METGAKKPGRNAGVIRVLIVDDSAFMRALLRDILSSDPELDVVGTAADAFIAREKIKALAPDVITLDIEMPQMDGLAFLDKLMALHPLPVVMVSSLTRRGADMTLRALEAGAVDFVAKPDGSGVTGIMALRDEIIAKVKAAARAKVGPRRAQPSVRPPAQASVAVRPRSEPASAGSADRIVLIGASTGGIEALRVILSGLAGAVPPVVIVQHMPPNFTRSFAERLNRSLELEVMEADRDMPLRPRHVYIAAGDRHLTLVRGQGGLAVQPADGPVEGGHKPSVDVLFRSALPFARRVVAVILTGMGKDGAQGLSALRGAGARTLGQDEASSLVYGMPKAAFEAGAVERQVALPQMADAILDLARTPGKGRGGASHREEGEARCRA